MSEAEVQNMMSNSQVILLPRKKKKNLLNEEQTKVKLKVKCLRRT